MKKKGMVALLLAGVMAAGVLTGCSKENEGNDTKNSVKITFFHTKGEIHEGLETLAELYEKKTGVQVEVQVAGAGESPYTRITSMYNSGTAPTLAMLDATDIVALGAEKAVDLSNEEWVKECEDVITKVDGKVYSYPFCVEGRGIIYNRKAIEDTLGTSFNPDSINSYDALKNIFEQLRTKGMENPIIISKEDWSLGAHHLGYLYDAYDGTNEGAQSVIDQLNAGTFDLFNYNRFNQFVDTFQLFMEYNYNKKDPLGVAYEEDPIHFVDGDAAFWFNGCWAWPNLVEAGASKEDDYGFVPYVLGNDTSDFANTTIQAAGSKQIMIDKVQASEEQIQAAKDFISWMVFDAEGQKAVVEECAIIPSCKNNKTPLVDPLGQNIMDYMNAGRTFATSAIVPGDHWTVLGAQMQKFLSGNCTKEELGNAIIDYWKKVQQ